MATVPKISFPVPANAAGTEFASSDALLDALNGESSGLYLVGSQGMWHGGIHITNATIPWCALTGKNAAELEYAHVPYKGEQAVRCMADGEIVAYRACQDYDFIDWRSGKLFLSSSFVLVKHTVQPDENTAHGLDFHTLYMNLAPVSAYSQTDANLRKAAKGQNYYTTPANVQANGAAGQLPVNAQVRLGEQVVTSATNHRQYSEVTIIADTGTLKAGDKVWTVSDRGWLKAESEQGAAVPSWWGKCSPALHSGTANAPLYKTSSGLKYYLSSADVEAGISAETKAGNLITGFPVFYDASNAALQFTRSDGRLFSLVTLGKNVDLQKKGDRVWVVSDNDNLVAEGAGSSSGQAVYDQVVTLDTPVKIAAGDSIGHMGFYELPQDNGKLSRYQVHIECLSMDTKLPSFLTNPGNVGKDAPVYLSYPENAVLMMPDAQGKMTATDRKTRAPGILTRSTVPGVDAEGHALADNKSAEQYQIRPEGGWLAKADVKPLSQWDLGALGFVTLDKAPASFDLIDGIHHPDNVVKGILEELYKAAQEETRSSHAMNQYNYKRLLDQIDGPEKDGHYSEQEYLQAVHNPSYRSHLYRLIAKHPSEWYYEKSDAFWTSYLNTLTTDAPVWKAYTESFIDKMAWMKKVAGMGPEPWHMHPVVFLGAMNISAKWFDIEAFIAKYKEQHSDTFGFFDRGDKIHIPLLTLESESALRTLLNEMKSQYYNYFDIFNEKFVSYMLATVRIESYDYRQRLFFKPISEKISSEKAEIDYGSGPTASNPQRAVLNHNTNIGDGYKYRGRGLVQLTWKISYEKFKTITGIDIVTDPDLCLEISTAVSIMMKGMKDGGFRSGHTLERYLGEGKNDYFNARLIINGYTHGIPDKADEFKDYAELFERIINETI